MSVASFNLLNIAGVRFYIPISLCSTQRSDKGLRRHNPRNCRTYVEPSSGAVGNSEGDDMKNLSKVQERALDEIAQSGEHGCEMIERALDTEVEQSTRRARGEG
jgi:hypothetical protein